MQVYLVQGLAWGDEGKGSMVDYLVRRHNAPLVFRWGGGPQCGHTVHVPGRGSHRFAQFGSGTLAGAATYLGPEMVIEPLAMMNEANRLNDWLGAGMPWERLTVHPDCPVTTPYHWLANQLKETARSDSRHGSCGSGLGEVRASILEGGPVLRARDLKGGDWRPRLREIAVWQRRRVVDWLATSGEVRVPPAAYEHYLGRVVRDDYSIAVEEAYMRFLLRVEVAELDLSGFDVLIGEGHQGVLLDQQYGQAPHTTWSDCTYDGAHRLLDGISCVVERIGVLRTYMTRHGAGPLPTEVGAVEGEIDNPPNEWQGPFRRGYFDAELVNLAIRLASPYVLALTHMDQIGPAWRYADAYDDPMRPRYRDIRTHHVVSTLEERLRTPVKYLSTGPTWEDKITRGEICG